VQPGYEDVWYYLWRERRLPVNVDPFNSRLDDEMERSRLRRVFDQKLDSIVGYVLPIQAGEGPRLAGPVWTTGPWFLRDERLYLMPGDSPMGLRLPLDSLPWVSKADFPYLIEQDPSAPRAALSPYDHIAARYAAPAAGGTAGAGIDGASAAPGNPGGTPYLSGSGPQAEAARRLQDPLAGAGTAGHHAQHAGQPEPAQFARVPQRQESAYWVRRTALCVEVRDPRRASGPKAEAVGEKSGVLYVFMPPLERLEDYLDLLAAIEATAQEQGVQLVLEGYPPPRDPRLRLLQVTPDPGVIEVNIHPVSHWNELVHHTEFLYQAAFECRLSAEKFMTDGRHTGTGGGNHFVLGGATPADSPFLRRPGAAGQPAAVLAQPPQPELPVLRHVHRPDEPGARASTRPATTSSTSWRSRCSEIHRNRRAARPGEAGELGGHAALAGGPHAAQHPDRRHRQHAPQRVLRSTSCTRRIPPPGGWACWSCARSRCRRMRA
jgi:uncharacterized protein (DUF2126 family)